VEGLKPENVTVVDTKGNILSSGLSTESEFKNNTIELTQAQLALQRQYERELQNSVQSMLEHVLGPGKAVVRVSAELNFDEKESRMEIYSPLQDKKTPDTFVRSESRLDEFSESTGQAPTAGSPGTDTNIPTYQQENPATESSTTEKSERIVNYEIDKEEVLQRFAPGAVKRLTVAVVVDQELNASQEDQLQRMVETAVGIDRNSPDQSNRTVSVTGMRFSQIQEAPVEEPIWKTLPWYVWTLLAVLVIAAVILLLRQISRRKPDEEESFEALAGEEIKLQDILEREISPEEREKKMIREEIEKLVDTNPEDAANLIRTWLWEEGV